MTDSLRVSDSVNLGDLSTVKLRALWALDVLTNTTKERFKAPEIAEYLTEVRHVNTSRQAVTAAFAKDRLLVNKNKSGYKLMEAGRTSLANSTSSRVRVIESGKPFFAKNVVLKEIFATFSGSIQIVDPYVDINTLDVLYKNLNREIPVRLLTQKIANKPQGVFERHLGEIRQDGFQIEVRRYENSELHDRYIIDDKEIWHSGNSLNFLGNRESFLILLSEDTREIILSKFNERWKLAKAL